MLLLVFLLLLSRLPLHRHDTTSWVPRVRRLFLPAFLHRTFCQPSSGLPVPSDDEPVRGGLCFCSACSRCIMCCYPSAPMWCPCLRCSPCHGLRFPSRVTPEGPVLLQVAVMPWGCDSGVPWGRDAVGTWGRGDVMPGCHGDVGTWMLPIRMGPGSIHAAVDIRGCVFFTLGPSEFWLIASSCASPTPGEWWPWAPADLGLWFLVHLAAPGGSQDS